MRRRLSIILTTLLAAALLVPSAAMAAGSTNYSFSGSNADAWSMTEDADGSYSSLSVWGGALTNKYVDGAKKPIPMKGEYGFVMWDEYIPATDSAPETYRVSYCLEAPADFETDRLLTRASLSFSAPLQVDVWYDEMPWEGDELSDAEYLAPDPDQSTIADVDVHVTWAGVGSLWRESFSFKSRTDDFFSFDRSKSTRRAATAHLTVADADGIAYFDGDLADANIYDSKNLSHMKGIWPEY